MPDEEIISLPEAPPGCGLVVVSVEGGRGVVARLHDLGLLPGVNVRVLRRGTGRGPCLILLGERRLALGYGVARRVTVRRAQERCG